MSVNIEYIDANIILISYHGLIRPADMLRAYTEIYDYSQTREVHYVLLYAVEAMYYEEQLFTPDLLNLKYQVVSQETFKSTIVISMLSQPLRQSMIDIFHDWQMGHKLFFAKNKDAAFDYIANQVN